MPIIASAKKALRQNKKRRLINSSKKSNLKKLVNKVSKSKSLKDVSLLYSMTDKAVKKGLIHRNKAKRIKRKMAKLTSKLA